MANFGCNARLDKVVCSRKKATVLEWRRELGTMRDWLLPQTRPRQGCLHQISNSKQHFNHRKLSLFNSVLCE